MINLDENHPDINQVLKGLKDFQKETVDYVFERMYLDNDRVSRFLVADEVGLGKTLVARGIIARTIDYLWNKEKRIDIIYICSNQDIAQQNIDRLNIMSAREFSYSSRATLMPLTIKKLRNNRLNFVSLTPGTSFNLRSSTGIYWERILLFNLILAANWQVSSEKLSTILRFDMKPNRWAVNCNWFNQTEKIDEELQDAFLIELEKLPKLRSQLDEIMYSMGSDVHRVPSSSRDKQVNWISQLRSTLAKSSMAALEPDLIILDEFQRFKNLLATNTETGLLARELFTYPKARVLLLSATPYKMYTLPGEEGEDHFRDFEDTVNFLLDNKIQEKHLLHDAIRRYRRSYILTGSGEDHLENLVDAKKTIERVLCKVMVRTERLTATEDRNGMLTEAKTVKTEDLRSEDFESFVYLDRIAQTIQAGDIVEYWKSSAYPLNLMEDYKIKQKFETAIKQNPSEQLIKNLQHASPYFLHWGEIQSYQKIDPGNARLRAMFRPTLETGNWCLLWLPASLPYYQPPINSLYPEINQDGCTKTLVFSAWKVVPKVISTLLSYEAERRMLENIEKDFEYQDLTRKRRQLLKFAIKLGKPSNMSVFSILYPCLTLAQKIDPLALAKKISQSDPPYLHYLLSRIKIEISKLLEITTINVPQVITEAKDQRWYWAALFLMDYAYVGVTFFL